MPGLIGTVLRRIASAEWFGKHHETAKPDKSLVGTDEEIETRFRKLGHRGYIGGLWDEIGKLQFDFLADHGLQPHHYLCDVGCGSLRGGVHFVRYLEPGHYLGLDREHRLIDAGIRCELGPDLFEAKKPQFVVSSEFAFEKFSTKADYALAQSLLTHLAPPTIKDCLTKLRPRMNGGGVFYATFFEVPKPTRKNPSYSHPLRDYFYTRRQMQAWGEECGWKAEYLGDWHHPRGQLMMRYTAP